MDNFFKDTPDFKFHLKDPIVKKNCKVKRTEFQRIRRI